MKKTVLVTGFGPFGGHTVNASWECVKNLKNVELEEDINLFIQEIPVVYDSVKVLVPKLWKELKPDLVVHVGVSHLAKELVLEQQAHNDGYCREDINGCVAMNGCCVAEADDCLISDLDMKRVCNIVNSSSSKVKAVVSYDAGRYLCDYSYFTSLHINKQQAAFIHVPPLNAPHSVDELTGALKIAILDMLKQIM